VINLGPQISYGFNAYERKNASDLAFATRNIDDLTLKNNRTVHWQFGITGGVGINLILGKFVLQAEGRYYNGFSHVISPRTYSFFSNQTFGAYLSLLYSLPLKSKTILSTDKIENP
jgi:hypothetical protein